MKRILKLAIHKVTNIRSFQEKKLTEFAKNKQGLGILEIGSGKKVDDRYEYSFIDFFSSTNKFQQSDFDESYGHKVVDVTRMVFSSEFDIILCMNVLEHVYDCRAAINNIHRALKKNGTAIITVPFIYPLHDEPGDYWRFTEHSMRKLLEKFSHIEISYNGKREFAYCYFIKATK